MFLQNLRSNLMGKIVFHIFFNRTTYKDKSKLLLKKNEDVPMHSSFKKLLKISETTVELRQELAYFPKDFLPRSIKSQQSTVTMGMDLWIRTIQIIFKKLVRILFH